ncbi:unnamed protein product [Vitrella brassicaformis CCMP3155]|uniref:SCP domain-containing protein n=1 Tax=Vitrella brassicaformis (strain CCMP3155) TaxID=1169540 RepID=A0A0G4EPF0_VITBC|nr:unnamed protein product [Vitrella brassicaformis CCMP3155]|eukprot:CEL99309.1 unnamed protein product [Vitrella brassicaformis CCMP3155]
MGRLLSLFLVALAAVAATPASAYPPPAAGGGRMWMACRPPDGIDEPLLRDDKPTEIALDACQIARQGLWRQMRPTEGLRVNTGRLAAKRAWWWKESSPTESSTGTAWSPAAVCPKWTSCPSRS